MQLPERIDDPTEAIRTAVLGVLKEVWTVQPAIVQAASDGHTATIQHAINAMITMDDGSVQSQAMPLLSDAPVHFAGGGGVTTTHPIATGDEGIAIHAARNQDGWHQSGGIQDPIDARIHSLSDARYIPGGRSNPRMLSPAPSNTSGQTRSDDGNHVADLHPTNGLTQASTTKSMTIVGGTSGAATMTTPQSIIKNAPRIMMNCVSQAGLPPPGATLANMMAITPQPPPPMGPMAATMASAMASVLSGGPSALFSDPTAGANAALSAATSSGAASLASALGGAAATMVAAMTGGGGLAAALATLATGTSMMSGTVAPTGDAFGLQDILDHATALQQYFGTATPPTSVALASVLGPLQSGPMLSSNETALNALVASVIAGSTTIAAGTAAVEAMNTSISGMMTGANSALTTMQTALPALQLAAMAGSAGISQNPALAAVFGAVANSGLSSLSSAMGAVFAPLASEMAAMTSFPDPSASQPGACGGL